MISCGTKHFYIEYICLNILNIYCLSLSKTLVRFYHNTVGKLRFRRLSDLPEVSWPASGTG